MTPEQQAQHTTDDGTISLKPLFDVLARYRRVILLAIVGTVSVTAVGLAVAALVLPREQTSSLQFRLLFTGAAQNLYPNNTAFNPAEIVDTAVLADVFKVNDLQRFGKYEDFKNTLTVLASSREREMLDLDYAGRLADTKLTPVERIRLEDEYRKKREALQDPVFMLSMRRTERFQTMPRALAEKVLNDALATWAKQATEIKGALRFQVDMLSRGFLTKSVLDQDFLLAADSLRTQTSRLLKITADLAEVPGASTVRTPKDGVSLPDVRAGLEDIQRYQIHPLLNIIRSEGVAKDPQATARFVSGQVAHVGIARAVTKQRIQALQTALQIYMARGGRTESAGPLSSQGRPGSTGDTQGVAPQLSESFLDRLIEMSAPTQASEVAYRQKLTNEIIDENGRLADLEESFAFYQDLEQSMKSAARSPATNTRLEEVNRLLHASFEAVGGAMDKLGNLVDEMSRVSLTPTSLYVVTRPFATQTRYGLSLYGAVMTLILATLLACVVAPLVCLARHSTRRA